MPLRQLQPRQLSSDARELKDRLIAEWRSPDPAAQQPVILEESGHPNQPLHVYVIWDEWAPLPQVERSEIIIDAYQERYGQAQSLNVTVAMGLTPEEADRMGIRYR
jgi:hypothetical protein